MIDKELNISGICFKIFMFTKEVAIIMFKNNCSFALMTLRSTTFIDIHTFFAISSFHQKFLISRNLV